MNRIFRTHRADNIARVILALPPGVYSTNKLVAVLEAQIGGLNYANNTAAVLPILKELAARFPERVQRFDDARRGPGGHGPSWQIFAEKVEPAVRPLLPTDPDHMILLRVEEKLDRVLALLGAGKGAVG